MRKFAVLSVLAFCALSTVVVSANTSPSSYDRCLQEADKRHDALVKLAKHQCVADHARCVHFPYESERYNECEFSALKKYQELDRSAGVRLDQEKEACLKLNNQFFN